MSLTLIDAPSPNFNERLHPLDMLARDGHAQGDRFFLADVLDYPGGACAGLPVAQAQRRGHPADGGLRRGFLLRAEPECVLHRLAIAEDQLQEIIAPEVVLRVNGRGRHPQDGGQPAAAPRR